MTGSELMSGDVVDTNSAFIAQNLADIGLSIYERCVVGDDPEMLQQAITRLSNEYDALIINGGLGPTEDDLTAQVLAQCSEHPLQLHKDAEQHVMQWCLQRGFDANTSNLKQALLPQNACIFADAPGSAPAFYIHHNQCLIIATPGVPSEIKNILETSLLPFLQQQFPVENAASWIRYTLIGIGESSLQELINKEFSHLSDYFNIGFRAGFPSLEFKLYPLPVAAKLLAKQESIKLQMINKLKPYILGEGNISIAQALVKLLQQRNKTISCAESCTGGLIASEITKIPGSSAVFPGSVVSYSNAMKQKFLGVNARTLEAKGAVSKDCALEMLDGILNSCQSDYGIAVTGIAGPDGGCEEKPVGTVWIAWGTKKQKQAICLHIGFERELFQTLVMAIALDLIRRQLLGLGLPEMISRWQRKD